MTIKFTYFLIMAVLAVSTCALRPSGARRGSRASLAALSAERTGLKSSTGLSSDTGDRQLVTPSYNFAVGCWGVSAALIFGAHIPLLSIPFVLLGALLTVQTGRVRFAFDSTAMEVLKKQKDGEITKSGENFAVGGENRWAYKSFTSWNFIPNKSFPLFMYFRESQTPNAPPEGQFHLFPMLFNADELGALMVDKVGEEKQF